MGGETRPFPVHPAGYAASSPGRYCADVAFLPETRPIVHHRQSCVTLAITRPASSVIAGDDFGTSASELINFGAAENHDGPR